MATIVNVNTVQLIVRVSLSITTVNIKSPVQTDLSFVINKSSLTNTNVFGELRKIVLVLFPFVLVEVRFVFVLNAVTINLLRGSTALVFATPRFNRYWSKTDTRQ